jgi:hypothetical protein
MAFYPDGGRYVFRNVVEVEVERSGSQNVDGFELRSRFIIRAEIKVHNDKCDQIGRIFAIWANF